MAEVCNIGLEYPPFKDAREFVHTLGLKSREEWKKYYKSGKMSADIPLGPESVYKNEWKGWGGLARQWKYSTF
jgi:hypothetical protein